MSFSKIETLQRITAQAFQGLRYIRVFWFPAESHWSPVISAWLWSVRVTAGGSLAYGVSHTHSRILGWGSLTCTNKCKCIRISKYYPRAWTWTSRTAKSLARREEPRGCRRGEAILMQDIAFHCCPNHLRIEAMIVDVKAIVVTPHRFIIGANKDAFDQFLGCLLQSYNSMTGSAFSSFLPSDPLFFGADFVRFD